MKRLYTSFRLVCLAALSVWFCSCSPVLIPFDENVPAQTLSYVGAPPVQDGRDRFREIFCGLLNNKKHQLGLKIACDDYLWRLNDEPLVPERPADLPEHDLDIHIMIVPGAFADCFGDIGITYRDAVEQMKKIGYRIDYIGVGGLSSSERNADIIAEAIAEIKAEPSQRLVLLGYSKGTTDILHFLIAHPEPARRVKAVLSVAGAVNGSALADRYSATEYDNWLAGLFAGKCQPGDRGVFDSLSRKRQFQWLVKHPLPKHVRYYSLASFARYENIQLNLRATYNMLEKISPLNDGQLLFIDQLIPGSALLGYINADHWTVAIPVEEKYSDRDPALQDRNRKLRALLFEAMLLFLSENLEVASP